MRAATGEMRGGKLAVVAAEPGMLSADREMAGAQPLLCAARTSLPRMQPVLRAANARMLAAHPVLRIGPGLVRPFPVLGRGDRPSRGTE